MNELKNIAVHVQEVAEAISAILGIDVTIITNDLIRIAATGKYKSSIGEQLPSGCSYEYILKNKKTESVIERNLSNRCINCSHIDSCSEIANIGYPILSKENEVLGVIGLIAFESDKKDYINENFAKINLFLNKLSFLLAGNLKYEETIKTLSLKNKEFSNIANSLEYGVILTDKNNKILNYNKKTLEILNCRYRDLDNKYIFDIFNNIDTHNLFENNIVSLKGNLNINNEEFLVKYMINSLNNDVKSYIYQISKYSSAILNAYNIIYSNENINFHNILGNSITIKNTITLAKQISPGNSFVIIRGESGTGKELFARAIHNSSNRAKYPFIKIDCENIADNLLEGEFFGYISNNSKNNQKQVRIGKFELANKGTIFLDEITSIPLHLQSKILKVLKENSIIRLGSEEKVNIDIRIISSSSKNLEKMVEDGLFMRELYYKLNVIPINIPPLRERINDVEIIANSKLKEYCQRLNKDQKIFSKDLINIFKKSTWKGNIKEIEKIVEYLVNISDEKIIGPDCLPNSFNSFYMDNINIKSAEDIDINKKSSLQDLTENFEKEVLTAYLNKYGNSTKSKQKIADLLKINLSTLYRKLYRYEII